MFYYEILWIYQNFKSENLFFLSILISRSENTGLITRGHVKSSQMREEASLQLSRLSFMLKRGLNNKEIQLNLCNLFPTLMNSYFCFLYLMNSIYLPNES